jgi:exonuclease VII large subunit
MLEAYAFENVLQRGFVLMRDETGKVVTEAQDLRADQNIVLRFAKEIEVPARVTGTAAKRQNQPC